MKRLANPTTHLQYEEFREFEAQLGSSVRLAHAVSGGDIASAFQIEMSDGTRIFLKDYGEDTPESDFGDERSRGPATCEAEGLEWLRDATSLRVPEVVAFSERWLALEWIESGPARKDFGSVLGRGLAELHANHAPSFGQGRPNWIGRLPQPNEERSNWGSFYADMRILPMIDRAERCAALPLRIRTLLEEFVDAIPRLVGPDEKPSRLHGDLWGGNVLPDESGMPCLIDPAVYGGHREVDLAMLALFGGMDSSFERAYDEAFPLAPGAASRRPLYQVYPLLVHVCLFGESYCASLESACKKALSG